MMNATRASHLYPTAVATAGLLLSSTAAQAGVADSPVPFLAGSPARHIYTIPGVIKNNNLETLFMCTSMESFSVTIAVQVFAATGGDPLNDVVGGEGVETVAPGGTATFATGATVAFHEDDTIGTLGAASLRNGSARIIATSKRIACDAFVVDEFGTTPVTMAPLKILSKTKQHGE
jgi:hypothetical protein